MGLSVLFNNLQNLDGGVSSGGPTGPQTMSATLKVSRFRTIIQELIPERTTQTITLVLTDDNNQDLPLDLLGVLTLTLYVVATGARINGRDRQNILNANGVTVEQTTAKVLTITYPMDPLDNQVVGSGLTEQHIALFEWTLNGKADKHEILHRVLNLENVP